MLRQLARQQADGTTRDHLWLPGRRCEPPRGVEAQNELAVDRLDLGTGDVVVRQVDAVFLDLPGRQGHRPVGHVVDLGMSPAGC
jgi:hypothetical protein